MKKIILASLFALVAMISNAQSFMMSINYGGIDIPVPNGQSYPYPSSVDPSTLPVVLNCKITNTGVTPLVLTQTSGKYIVLTGTGSGDFIVDESALTGTIAPSGSQTFSLTFSSTAPNGTRTVTINVASNAPAYTGSLTYTIQKATTGTISASSIGLSVFPNPSSTGTLNIQSSAQLNKVEVIGVNGVVETFTTSVFTTSQKGLLVVRMYTDKGIVTEKVLVQ